MKRDPLQPVLDERMTARADADRLPLNHPMRTQSLELTNALRALVECPPGPTPDTVLRGVLRAWARARKVWSDYTGEPII